MSPIELAAFFAALALCCLMWAGAASLHRFRRVAAACLIFAIGFAVAGLVVLFAGGGR